MKMIALNTICAFVVAIVSAHAHAAEAQKNAAMDAEFAVRWDPSAGGPKSAQQVLDLLALKRTDKDDFEAIRYYDATKTIQAPKGANVILRERVKKKSADLTFKLRSGEALPAAAPGWCPLGTAAEAKDEVDVSVLSMSAEKKAYSRSCKLKVDPGTPFPPALEAKPKGCQSKMARLESGSVTVEEWKLPNGSTILELSKTGKDTPAELAAFRNQLVAVVIKAGAKPVDRSMTEAGSDCK